MTTSADQKRPRWAAVPAQRSNAPTLRVKLWLVLGALVTSALLGVVAIVVTLTAGNEPVTVATGPSDFSVAVAEAVAADFLAGRETRQPVAEGVDPTFGGAGGALAVTRVAYVATQTADPTVAGPVSVHVFLVAVENGRFYLRVPMIDTPTGPVLGALPLLSPAPTYPAPDPVGPPAGVETVTVRPAVAQQINDWAVAYAENRGDELAAIAGNNDPNARFAGLGGFTAVRVTPQWAYPRGETAIVVRVQLLVQAAGANGFSTAMDLDLLVLNPDSAARPPVAAWGAAGTGPTLQPNANNLTRP